MSGESGLVLGVTRMTYHNGPGIRTLVQLKGCPLRCLWCSTPESQQPYPEIVFDERRCTQCEECIGVCSTDSLLLDSDRIRFQRSTCNACGRCAQVCPPQALTVLGRNWTAERLVEDIEKDYLFYKHSGGGVTLSGGEPMLQPDFILEVMRLCQRRGISVGIDTAGYTDWRIIERAIPYCDFFLWDIKHMDSKTHQELTGVENDAILANALAVAESGARIYLRLPIITGYTDSLQNFKESCDFARSLRSLVEMHLLPVHHLGKARYASLGRSYPIMDVPLVARERLERMVSLAVGRGLRCRVVE